MKKHLKKAFSSLVILNILLTTAFYLAPINNVHASSQIVLTSIADSFVRSDSPSSNYGSWNAIAIGPNWNSGNYIVGAQAYIKFDLSSITPQSIIESASIDVYQYVRSDMASGNYLVNVSKVVSDWSEGGITWNNKPNFSGNYAESWVNGYGDQWFNPPKKFSWDITNLVKEWQSGSPNYGLAMFLSSGNYGGFWCSRNYNDSTCFASSVPQLRITYSQNLPPNTPNPTSPSNLAEFGGDSTQAGSEVTLKVNDLGDPNGNFDGTYFYYRRQGEVWNVSSKRTGTQTAQFTNTFSDGMWEWQARSVDSMGLWSDYSPLKTFTVDTTPPAASTILSEPEFSPGTQNTVTAAESNDTLIVGVRYKFKVYSGGNCDNLITESEWQESREFSILNLNNDEIHCYQVKTRDKLGNGTGWSDFVTSIQDAIFPVIQSLAIDRVTISPNGDGLFDNASFAFNIAEEHFDKWELTIVNSPDSVVRRIGGNSLVDTVIWDGRDDDGNIIEDGLCRFNFSVRDKAGNEVQDNSILVSVDNIPALLNISQPKDGSWFNSPNVTIAGITEPLAKVLINGSDLPVDANGIFEASKPIDIGENVFNVSATDEVGNKSDVTIHVHKELNPPVASFESPAEIINDRTPVISLSLNDTSSEASQSGIDPQSLYLSIANTQDETGELVLVNEGQDLHSELGHITTDCGGSFQGGILVCNYSYLFDSPLEPDGVYKIRASVRDIAGNVSDIDVKDFILDSNTYLSVTNPSDGMIFNHSLIAIAGKAEEGSKITVTTPKGQVVFDVTPEDVGVENCTAVDESFGEGWEGIGNVCDFIISDIPLEANFTEDINVVNNILVVVQDKAGNNQSIMKTVNVNLFAITLGISSNLMYISPNDDGRQDGMMFSMTAENRDEQNGDVIIRSWVVDIKDEGSNSVRQIDGSSILPPSIYFDGRNNDGEILADGKYTFALSLVSSDNINFSTLEVEFHIKTLVSGEVAITSPQSNTVTSRGVVTIQGQAPLDTVVTLCVDLVGIEGDCNDSQVVSVSGQGFFTGIVPLSMKESFIWAYATDAAGNITPRSNSVKIILDFSDPLISVEALPSISGIRQEVILRSLVTQYTERVDIKFADYSNLSELPDSQVDLYTIGTIDNLDNGQLGDPCDAVECRWDLSWITPPVTGGVYEIEFTAKKGENFKTLSLGVRIDGTIPTPPTITDFINPDSLNSLRFFNGKYYSNSSSLIVKGISEPLTYTEIYIDDIQSLTVKSDARGKWVGAIGFDETENLATHEVSALSRDEVNNTSESSGHEMVVIDKVKPNIINATSSKNFYKSGSNADITLDTDEPLFASTAIRTDGAGFKLSRGNSESEFIGFLPIQSDAPEGNYKIHLTALDFAGNLGTSDLGIIIDNTSPQASNIDDTDWGNFNGVNAKFTIPALGRLVPGYVTRNNNLEITGTAEQYSSVEIWMNSVLTDTIKVSGTSCQGETLAYTGTKYRLCEWHYILNLGGDQKGHILQTKAVDRAGNYSEASKEVILYIDTLSPTVPLLASRQNYKSDLLGNITNQMYLHLSGTSERLADIQMNLLTPKGKQESRLVQVSDLGEWGVDLTLGQNLGAMEDGAYIMKLVAFDAPGNTSGEFTIQIERDTVAPLAPTVQILPDDAGHTVGLSVKGEPYSNAAVLVYRNGTVISNSLYSTNNQGQITVNSIAPWLWDSNYKFEVYSSDRAGNISPTNTQTYNTPKGSGDVEAATIGNWNDPYGGKTGENVDRSLGTVKIYPDGRVEIDFEVEAPEITYTSTSENGDVFFWGIGPNKGSVNVEFYRKHEQNFAVDINEAYKRCGWEKYVPIVSIIYAPVCVRKKFNEIQNEVKFDHEIFNFPFNPQNAEITLYKDGKQVGGGYSVDTSGRWTATVSGSILRSPDYIQAKARVWGYYIIGGIEVHYNKESGLGNGAVALKIPDYYPDGLPFDGNFILTGTPKTHAQRPEKAAVDIQLFYNTSSGSWKVKDDAELLAIVDGYTRFYYADNGAAIVTISTENNAWNVHYAHIEDVTDRAKNVIKDLPRKVHKGDLIGYQGHTGKYNGVQVAEHLHYEISRFINSKETNYDSKIGICNLTGLSNECVYRDTKGYPPLKYYKFKT